VTEHPRHDILAELGPEERERLEPIVLRLEQLDRAAWEDPGPLPPLVLPPPRERRFRWRRPLVLRPLPAAALAALLLAVGVAAGVLLAGDDDGQVRGRVIALAPVEPLGGDARGTATLSGRTATVRLSGLKPTRGGDFYELWLLNSPDDLVSLGSFAVPASGEVDVTVPVPTDPRRFAAIDVSEEPPDGDPAHSSRSVLRAPLKSPGSS
jgi:Anti-sigma-K factor rskA, C-terminal